MKTTFYIMRFFDSQKKRFARILLVVMVLQLLPYNAFALTGGPSQPEVQSFEPVGTSEMVDVSTGDFNYNIPLMDIGGYPINISYHAGIEMDQEASWVGLGWNLSPGVMNRNMRGLPDDFSGKDDGTPDRILKQYSTKDNWTVSTNFGLSNSVEVFGLDANIVKANLGGNLGIKYNSYRGVGFEFGIQPSISVGLSSFSSLNAGLDMGYDSESGLSMSPSASIEVHGDVDESNAKVKAGFNIGMSFNSRTGMQAINYGISATRRNNELGLSISPSAAYTFGTQTYFPQISSERRNDGININFSAGTEFTGINPNIRIGAAFNIDKISRDYKMGVLKDAYGYFYEHEKGTNTDVLLDFNREKDGTFTLNNTNLPLTNHTYDVYAAAGQGIGGSFRPFRGDVPMLHDDFSKNFGYSISLGGEIGVLNISKWGANLGATFNKNTTGAWLYDAQNLAGNGLSERMNFSSTNAANDPSYEPAYFKNSADWSFTSDFDTLRFNSKLVSPIVSGVKSNNGEYYIPEGYKPKTSTQTQFTAYVKRGTSANTRTKREPRNSAVSMLTAQEAVTAGLEKHIYNYSTSNMVTNGKLNRISISRIQHPRHHFSELTVTQPGGTRYVYGIPAYNTNQIEKSFNVSGNSHTCSNGQVSYTPDVDNTNLNTNGLDHYFQSSTIPGYAHSYLLTAYLSPDYVDLKNDGVTDDDLGTAVKFNYTRKEDNYRWRVPYELNSASYQEGQKSNLNDDIGSYTYGTKHIWYLHSVETKTQIAVFITSNREDGLGVLDEDGGKDTSQRVKKLDKIILFSKQDFLKYGLSAKPIKTVHFEYDYMLCPNVENNSGAAVAGNTNKGKLTLRKIYFTYGSSFKGRTTSYEFNYSSFNPHYNLKGSDWWGGYKRNPASSCGTEDSLNNGDFPYTLQDKTQADLNASAWCLTEIVLPSGGKITVQYESDDYAYVQDKRAMQMFKIAGFGSSDNPENEGNSLYWRSSGQERKHYDLIYVDLAETISGSDKLVEFKRRYLQGIERLQFTVFTDIDGKGHYEYVKGYAEVELEGCGINTGGTQAWIKVKKVKIGDKAHPDKYVNPLAKAAWNYARLRCDYLIYPFTNEEFKNAPNGANGIKKAVRDMSGIFADFLPILKGFNKYLEDKDFGRKVNLKKSWMRLNTPNFSKLGGGHRVKQINVNDNWSEIGGENSVANDALYGTAYEYTTEQVKSDGTFETISSGVSSYEPQVGGDENPFRLPRAIKVDYALIPDNEYFIETPMGESFFPSPSVVYSKVKTKALGYEGVEKTGTGFTISEYFTAKDFPVIVEETEMETVQEKPDAIESLFKFNKYTGIAAAQGYKIELNDMHGKPMSQYQYDEYNKLISGVMYKYQYIEKENKKRLTNFVRAVNNRGIISNAELGVEVDMVNDSRESNGEVWNFGLALNLDVFSIFIAPIMVPIVLPSGGKKQNEFHSIVTTKVVKRFGILEKTIAMKGGSSIETKNLLYDRSTGEVLLSATQNEFNDSTFDFSYPAHWAYDGMGQAYKNLNLTVSNVRVEHDQIILPNSLNEENYFVPGDECLLSRFSIANGTIQKRAFVYRGTGGNLNFIDDAGKEIPSANYNVKIYRSGRRNMASTPIGQVTTQTNPVVINGLAFSQVIDASATEFKDNWQTHLEYLPLTVCDTNALGSDLYQLISCLATGDYLKKIKSISFEGALYQSFHIDSFMKKSASGYIKKWKCMYQDTSVLAPLIKVGDSVFCDSFFYLSKVDTAWHYFDIFNIPQANKEFIQLYHTFYSDITASLCSGGCSSFYQNSRLKFEVDTFCDLDPDSCNGHSAVYKSTDTGFVLKIGQSGCSILDHACPIDIRLYKTNWQQVVSILNYDFDDGGENMYLTAVVLDYCGNYDTTLIEVNRCDESLRECQDLCYQTSQQYAINPYKSGLEGNWRPFRSYKYLDNRTYNNTSVDARKDGSYQSFVPFWAYSSGDKKYIPSTNSKWVWASEITKYSPFGNELETKDALNRYQAEVFGYYHTLPVAVANNCRYNQLAYDGFEDYYYEHSNFTNTCETSHFSFRAELDEDAFVDTSVSHSGWNSIKVTSGNNISVIRPITIPHTWNNSIDTTVTRKTNIFDDLGMFRPTAGKYLLGAWVKEDVASGATTYSSAHITITFTDQNDNTTSVNYYGSGKIIEGWQRIEGAFVVPENTKLITVTLHAATEDASWFDDIRMHAYDGNMKSYAYDYRTLRAMAVMDENNYATFYEYDAEGSLIRVKKETEKGIITIQENRTHILKKN